MSSSTIPTDLSKYITGKLTAAMDEQVRVVALGVLERAKAAAPPSPPEGDPDPAVSLRDSGRVERKRPGVYEITFDAPYAARQHEATTYKHPRGGRPKFLEAAILEAAAELPAALAGAVLEVTRSDRSYVRAIR